MNTSKFAAALTFALVASVASADSPPFAELAPADSVFILEIDDLSRLREALLGTPLGELWETDQIQQLVEEAGEEARDAIDELLEEFGIEIEDRLDLLPTGMVGAAMVIEMVEADEDETDEYGGFGPGDSVDTHMLLAAEYQDRAEQIEELLDAIVDRWVDDDLATLDEIEHGDSVIKVVEATGEARGFDPEDLTSLDADDVIGELDDLTFLDWPMFEKTYYARVGDMILASSSDAMMKHAIDRLEGLEGESLAKNPRYQRAMGKVKAGSYFTGAVFVQPLLEMMLEAEGMGDDEMSSLMLGLSSISTIESAAIGMAIDDGASIITQRFAVLTDGERQGMLALPSAIGSFEPPAFVGVDAVAVTSVGIDFPAIPELIEQTIAALPEEMAEMIAPGWEMFGPAVTMVFTGLGSEIVSITYHQRPYGIDSEITLVAIETKDAEQVAGSLMSAGMMLGLAERDFLGHRIFDIGDGGFSLGFGMGYMLIGPTDVVEQAFQSSERDRSLLSDTATFRAAASEVRPGGVWYGFTDVLAQWDYVRWTLINRAEILAAQQAKMRQDFLDGGASEEQVDRWYPAMEPDPVPEWFELLPTAEQLADYIGPSVMHTWITEDGFEGEWRSLGPVRD
ncbi:MAG: hypothetical protein KAS72_00535 [Phycisphaerales bacterium]|nr:hypothetical protein [Phycisphaerales bacterium]